MRDHPIRAPWDLTFAEFLAYRVPTPLTDGSRSPRDVETIRTETSTLADYRPSYLPAWLGAGGNPAYDMSALAAAVLAGDPLTVYRATRGDTVIWPGAYVTLSPRYAETHAAAHLGGDAVVLTTTARPDELAAINPNEFLYVPRDLLGWHRAQVAAAHEAGHALRPAVLADAGLGARETPRPRAPRR